MSFDTNKMLGLLIIKQATSMEDDVLVGTDLDLDLDEEEEVDKDLDEDTDDDEDEEDDSI